MLVVVGHKNPDTDSYVSAFAYAKYLQDTGHEAKACALGAPNKETSYIFQTLGVPFPEIIHGLDEGSQVILVDHNEASQSIDGRDNLHIAGVIDHHKIGDFETNGPLMMRIEPVGSTCTILYEIFKEKAYIPSPSTAKLMISAIISDTLFFNSPTTDQRDKDAVEALNDIAQITDLHSYAMSMFDAKSDLGDMPVKEIILLDFKQFDFHGHAMGIGVMETTNPDYAMGRKEEIIQGIHELKNEYGLDQLLFCVVDILQQTNIAFIASSRESHIVDGAFGVKTKFGCADLGHRVSRKKQIAPELDHRFKLNNA